jgi:hypothetical protein
MPTYHVQSDQKENKSEQALQIIGHVMNLNYMKCQRNVNFKATVCCVNLENNNIRQLAEQKHKQRKK